MPLLTGGNGVPWLPSGGRAPGAPGAAAGAAVGVGDTGADPAGVGVDAPVPGEVYELEPEPVDDDRGGAGGGCTHTAKSGPPAL